jgi:hypothetical protein
MSDLLEWLQYYYTGQGDKEKDKEPQGNSLGPPFSSGL